MGELSDIIKDAVIEQIRASLVTSARADWTNEVIDFSGEGNFEGIEDMVRQIIKQEMQNAQPQGTASKKKTNDGSDAEKELFQRNQEMEKRQDAMTKQLQQQEKQILKGMNAAKNPLGAGTDQLMNLLDRVPAAKMALKMLPFVAIAIEAPEIMNKIIQVLISPGGPFDRRLKIVLEEWEQQFIDRQEQKRRAIGLDQVVISQQGFGNAQGRLSTNSLNKVKTAGDSGIGLNEVQIGMKD